MGEKGPKRPNNRVFGLLRKIESLVYARNYLKWSVLWLARSRDLGKKGKNKVFGLLRKIESLVFARNGLKWSILWLPDFLRKSHIWENSYSRDLCAKALDQSDSLIFQITISFEPFNHFLYFCRVYTLQSDGARFFGKIPFFSKNGGKGPKNRVFGLLRKIESLVFSRNDLKWSVLWLDNFLHISRIWKNSRYWDLGQKSGFRTFAQNWVVSFF